MTTKEIIEDIKENIELSGFQTFCERKDESNYDGHSP